MKRDKLAAVFFAAAAVLWFAASAGAVDGTIEINQAKVMVHGFPYTITASGSYRLTGNLTVPKGSGLPGIQVSAPRVTIDLNGFSITGPGTSSLNIGINAANAMATAELTVENGTVTGFGSYGVYLANNSIIRNVHADSNGSGIFAGNNSLVHGCTANNNAQDGIAVDGTGVVISGNTVNGNAVGVILNGAPSALIIGNTLTNNSQYGIHASSTSVGYRENVMSGNGTNVYGATSLGNNLCSGALC